MKNADSNFRGHRALAFAVIAGCLVFPAFAQYTAPEPVLSPDAVTPDAALSPEQTSAPPVLSPGAIRPDPVLSPEQTNAPPVLSPDAVKPDPVLSPN